MRRLTSGRRARNFSDLGKGGSPLRARGLGLPAEGGYSDSSGRESSERKPGFASFYGRAFFEKIRGTRYTRERGDKICRCPACFPRSRLIHFRAQEASPSPPLGAPPAAETGASRRVFSGPFQGSRRVDAPIDAWSVAKEFLNRIKYKNRRTLNFSRSRRRAPVSPHEDPGGEPRRRAR